MLIYAAILCVGFVLGAVATFVFINQPNKSYQMYENMMIERSKPRANAMPPRT